MQLRTNVVFGFACALVVSLSACGSGGSVGNVPQSASNALAPRAMAAHLPPLPRFPAMPGAARGNGWMSTAARAPGAKLIYVADFIGNAIWIYPQAGDNPAPIGEITDGVSGPFGIAVDPAGSLYVCNVENYTVTKYPKGSKTWSLRYTGIGYPFNVTTGPHGRIYVVDTEPDQIIEFPNNDSRSLRTIPIQGPIGVAVDRADNLYVAYNTNPHGGGPGYVNEYPPKSKVGTQLGFTLGWAGGDAVDGSGNLAVIDMSGSPSAVDIFPPGATQPSQQITQGLADPLFLNFNKKHDRLFVADPGANAVLVYDYPSGQLVETLNNGLRSVYGVAVSPEGR